MEDLKFLMREAELGMVTGRASGLKVNRNRSQRQILHDWSRAAQERAYVRKQLVPLERFRQVIVGAQVKAADLIDLLAARRQYENRNISESTKRFAQLEA